MPIPKPRTGEDQGKFVSRCINFLADEGSSLSGNQRIAACYSAWRQAKKEELGNINPSVSSNFYPEVPKFPENLEKPKSYLEMLEEEIRLP